jgi:hypothetical protein
VGSRAHVHETKPFVEDPFLLKLQRSHVYRGGRRGLALGASVDLEVCWSSWRALLYYPHPIVVRSGRVWRRRSPRLRPGRRSGRACRAKQVPLLDHRRQLLINIQLSDHLPTGWAGEDRVLVRSARRSSPARLGQPTPPPLLGCSSPQRRAPLERSSLRREKTLWRSPPRREAPLR